MSEAPAGIHREKTIPPLQIKGPVVIGRTDPRKITKSEFDSSPDLIYHGAAKEFSYSPAGEYDMDDTGGDGSTDYGVGFYATDSPSQAQNYSLVRGHRKDPVVYKLLPHNARMLDVRDSQDENHNGILPQDFVQKWIAYLEKYVGNSTNFEHFPELVKDHFPTEIKRLFLEPVQDAIEKGDPPVIIRANNYKQENCVGIFNLNNNGLIDIAFSDFMQKEGYDGMVYMEKGEGKNKAPLTGYVFYNPAVINTWEGWQSRKEQTTSGTTTVSGTV